MLTIPKHDHEYRCHYPHTLREYVVSRMQDFYCAQITKGLNISNQRCTKNIQVCLDWRRKNSFALCKIKFLKQFETLIPYNGETGIILKHKENHDLTANVSVNRCEPPTMVT